MANEHNLLPKTEVEKEKSKDAKYDRLKTSRQNPRKVMLEEVVRGEIKTFPLVYKGSTIYRSGPSDDYLSGKEGRSWE